MGPPPIEKERRWLHGVVVVNGVQLAVVAGTQPIGAGDDRTTMFSRPLWGAPVIVKLTELFGSSVIGWL